MLGASPLGAVPLGGSPGGVDLSSASPITSLLSGDIRRIEHLVHLQPYDPDLAVTQHYYLSGGGFASGPLDSFPTGESLPHQYFEETLAGPPNRETRILQDGEINTGASSYGTLIIADPRRERTAMMGMTWKNARVDHYMGAPGWQFRQFARVFRGTAIDLLSDNVTYSLDIQDVVQKLQADYQPKTYAGRGPCVRFNGSTSYALGTVACPSTAASGGLTIGIRVRPRSAPSTNTTICGWRNGTAAGLRQIRTDASRAATVEIRNNVGTLFTVSVPSVFAAAAPWQWIHLWAVLDLAAMTLTLYNGETPDTPLGSVAVTGSFTTALSAFSLGRQADASAGFFGGDLDEVTVWNRALNTVEILSWTDTSVPVGTSGLVYRYGCDEGTGATLYEAGLAGPNLTLTSTAWVDSLTGGADVQGKKIPKGRGIRRKVKPVLLSSIDTIYQVAETFYAVAVDPADGKYLILDRGFKTWDLAYLGDFTDPWAATPAAGQWMSISSMGLVRLGSQPVGELTVDVYLTAATDLGTLVQALCETDAGLDPTEVDEGAAATLSALSGPTGFLAGLDAVSSDKLLTDLLSNVKGWRAPNRDGALSFGAIRPPETQAAVGTATGDDFALDGIAVQGTLPAARAVQISFAEYGVTQPVANVDPLLTEAQAQDLGQQFRTYQTPDSATVLDADPQAPLVTRTTNLDQESDARAEAAREAVWRSVPRRTDLLPLTIPVPKFQVGEVWFIRMNALDYHYGKNVIVGDVVADDTNGKHAIEVIGAVYPAHPPLIWDTGGVAVSSTDGRPILID